jgi:hypothetical protein
LGVPRGHSVEGEPIIWSPRGTDTVLAQFEVLAVRAGAALDPESSDFRVTWLDALRRESPNSKASITGIEQRPGGVQARCISGAITNVCEASADYCNVLERLAFQAESGKQAEGSHMVVNRETKELPPIRLHEPEQMATPLKEPRRRLRSTVESVAAARRLETFLGKSGIGQTEFAISIGTTDRTLRNFRSTGRIRRDLFEAMAREMGLTKEQLLMSE